VFAVLGKIIVKSTIVHCSFCNLTGKTQKLIDHISKDKTWMIYIHIFREADFDNSVVVASLRRRLSMNKSTKLKLDL
jgi:hypothetical protein